MKTEASVLSYAHNEHDRIENDIQKAEATLSDRKNLYGVAIQVMQEVAKARDHTIDDILIDLDLFVTSESHGSDARKLHKKYALLMYRNDQLMKGEPS